MAEQDPRDAIFDAWFHNRPLDQIEAYTQRGRFLRDIEMAELRRRWIAAFQRWAKVNHFAYSERQELNDIEGEALIRGEELPFDEVQELAAILHAEVKERMRDHPEWLEGAAEKLLAELNSFREKTKNHRKN